MKHLVFLLERLSKQMSATVLVQYVTRNVVVTKNVTKHGFIFDHDQPYPYLITHTKNANKTN